VQRLVRVIEEEVGRGAGVVVVSHEPEVFSGLAKARIVLERGKVVRAEA
jgi:heme exporter protein A